MTTYKSNNSLLSTILVSSSYKIIAFNIIVTGALKGIVSIALSCHNLNSECVTEPYAVNMVKSGNGLGM